MRLEGCDDASAAQVRTADTSMDAPLTRRWTDERPRYDTRLLDLERERRALEEEKAAFRRERTMFMERQATEIGNMGVSQRCDTNQPNPLLVARRVDSHG